MYEDDFFTCIICRSSMAHIALYGLWFEKLLYSIAISRYVCINHILFLENYQMFHPKSAQETINS